MPAPFGNVLLMTLTQAVMVVEARQHFDKRAFVMRPNRRERNLAREADHAPVSVGTTRQRVGAGYGLGKRRALMRIRHLGTVANRVNLGIFLGGSFGFVSVRPGFQCLRPGFKVGVAAFRCKFGFVLLSGHARSKQARFEFYDFGFD